MFWGLSIATNNAFDIVTIITTDMFAAIRKYY